MRHYFYIVITCLTLASAFSCSKKEEKPEPGSPNSKALRVGVVPISICQPFYDAYNQGLLDSLHANIALKHYNAFSECRIAIEDSLVDCVIMDSTLLEIINTSLPQGKKLRAVPLQSKTPIFHLLTSKKARIKHMSQMSDKVIGTDSHGTTHDIATAAIDSIILHKQLAFVIQCEDMRVRTDMLNTSNIDAAILPEPYATQALKAGATEIYLPKKIRQAPIVLAISPQVTSEQLIKLRKTIKAF